MTAYNLEELLRQLQQYGWKPPTATEESSALPPTPPPTEQQAQPTATTYELEFHKLLNQARQQQGVAALQYDNALAEIAEKHSIDMIQRNFFAHTNPSGDDPFERMKKAGYTGWRSAGENIGYFTTSNISAMSKQQVAKKFFDMWWNSDGHRRNMLSKNYNRHGTGIYVSGNKCMATDDFSWR